jgi:hypothetical protein
MPTWKTQGTTTNYMTLPWLHTSMMMNVRTTQGSPSWNYYKSLIIWVLVMEMAILESTTMATYTTSSELSLC